MIKRKKKDFYLVVGINTGTGIGNGIGTGTGKGELYITAGVGRYLKKNY